VARPDHRRRLGGNAGPARKDHGRAVQMEFPLVNGTYQGELSSDGSEIKGTRSQGARSRSSSSARRPRRLSRRRNRKLRRLRHSARPWM
jgi:hypothetical protein